MQESPGLRVHPVRGRIAQEPKAKIWQLSKRSWESTRYLEKVCEFAREAKEEINLLADVMTALE